MIITGNLAFMAFINIRICGCCQYPGTDQIQNLAVSFFQFTYICLSPDTPATTWHIEFRYGSDLAALQQYMKGQYAYWLAAGIDANADAETIDNVIALFCTENLSVEE